MQPQRHVESPVRTFFFERADGSIIAVQEKEAWGLYKHPPRIAGEERIAYKHIGTSDGAIFGQAVREAVALQETGDVEGAQALLLKAEQEEITKSRETVIPPRNMDKTGNGADLI